MTTLFNTNAAIETTLKHKFDNAIYDKEKSLLRKQFIQIIPSCFLQEKKQSHFYIPSTSSLKTHQQSEEFNKIQSEIERMEESIIDLEKAKKGKLAKIDDLRHIIRRIANEDSFNHCLFKEPAHLLCSSKTNNNITQRERCDKKTSSSNRKCQQSHERHSQVLVSSSSTTTTTTTMEPQPDQDPQGDGIKSGVHGCCNTNTNDDEEGEATDTKEGYLRCNVRKGNYCPISIPNAKEDELSQMLCYWQEYLPEMPKGNNAFMH